MINILIVKQLMIIVHMLYIAKTLAVPLFEVTFVRANRGPEVFVLSVAQPIRH